jgi:hypothetical protein
MKLSGNAANVGQMRKAENLKDTQLRGHRLRWADELLLK